MRNFSNPLTAYTFILLMLMAAPPVLAQQQDAVPSSVVVITADTLEADSKSNTAVFKGGVIAKSDEMTLHAEYMKVFYTDNGKIARIESSGKVKLIRKQGTVSAEHATYLSEEQKIIFTGSPRAIEGSSVITGTKMIYLINESRSIVENSRALFEQERIIREQP